MQLVNEIDLTERKISPAAQEFLDKKPINDEEAKHLLEFLNLNKSSSDLNELEKSSFVELLINCLNNIATTSELNTLEIALKRRMKSLTNSSKTSD